jgi:hypothetical protein
MLARMSSAAPAAPARPISLHRGPPLLPPRPGDVLLSFTVSFDGEAVLAWASPADEAKLRARDVKRGASFARSQVAAPGATVLVTIECRGEGWIEGRGDGPDTGQPAREAREVREVRELRGVTPGFPTVHRLPGDELLVLGPRASRRSGDPEHNAVVFGAEGLPVRSACLGDGISRCSVTASGAIWVGYFDEGVFGNYGWGDGPGSTPIGQPGWNRFDSALQLTWSHPDPEEGEIADCYALTTTGEECLVCPYTDWPILRASGGRTVRFERFASSVRGSHAMLAFGPQLALICGYSDERDRITAGTIGRKGLQWSPISGQLLLEGAPWNARSPLFGRDGVLHTVFENTWYSLKLGELIETLR